MKLKFISLIIFLAVFMSACIQNKSPEPTFEQYLGNYVTEDYKNRDEGYDWVAVSLDTIGNNQYRVLVRSRSDKKKPTCQYKSIVVPVNDSIFRSEFEGNGILFILGDNKLSIRAEDETDQITMYYFCSGGASLEGTYKKIPDPLDESQLITYNYRKSLSLQGINFDIRATNSGFMNQLIIVPSGLEIVNRPVHHEIDGTVTNAEIEDLNSDGSPEVLVYITSAGSGSYGSVIAYSVNNKKSMSQVYFPGIKDNPEASKGYMGHDEFAIVETSFVQRFPVYKENDTNAEPTGGMRQIQYKLVDGEASRMFKIDKIVEYPVN